MSISIILAIIIAIIFVVAVVFWLDTTSSFIGGFAGCVAVVMLLSFMLVPWSIRTVDSGTVAVVKHLGEIKEVKTAGTYFDFWIINKYIKYDAKVRTVEISTAAYSADAQPMDINMTIQYQIMNDKAVDIATHYGSIETLEDRITSIATEQAKSTLSKDKAMDIIANRASISPAVEEVIKAAVGEDYYVNIVTVVLTDIDFSDAFELAVEEKMIAEQTKLKADYENDTKVAKAEAEVEIAQAEANALLIKAEAEAEANKTIDKSLTENVLEKMMLDKWDGELPSVVGGEGNYMLPSDILK